MLKTARPAVRYPRGTVLRCPSCGQRVTLVLGANAVECNKDHPTVQMKEGK